MSLNVNPSQRSFSSPSPSAFRLVVPKLQLTKVPPCSDPGDAANRRVSFVATQIVSSLTNTPPTPSLSNRVSPLNVQTTDVTIEEVSSQEGNWSPNTAPTVNVSDRVFPLNAAQLGLEDVVTENISSPTDAVTITIPDVQLLETQLFALLPNTEQRARQGITLEKSIKILLSQLDLVKKRETLLAMIPFLKMKFTPKEPLALLNFLVGEVPAKDWADVIATFLLIPWTPDSDTRSITEFFQFVCWIPGDLRRELYAFLNQLSETEKMTLSQNPLVISTILMLFPQTERINVLNVANKKSFSFVGSFASTIDKIKPSRDPSFMSSLHQHLHAILCKKNYIFFNETMKNCEPSLKKWCVLAARVVVNSTVALELSAKNPLLKLSQEWLDSP